MADSLRGGGAATSCCVRSSAAGMRYSMCEPSVLSDLYRSRPSTCSSSSQACGVAFAMKHRKLNRVGGHWKWEVSPRRMGSKNFFVFSFDSILFRQKQTPAAAARHSFDDGAWTSLSYQQANQIQAQEDFREFLSGPPPGDLAHIEGFCRIYRIAEDLHCTVMDLIRNSSTTAVSAQTRASGDQQEGMSNISNPEDGDVSVREEAVVAGLARMAAVLQSGRQQLFESRVDANSAGQGHFDYTSGNKSISQFRMEMTSCCDHFQAALESLMPSNLDRNEVVYRCLERLRNVCLDTGFPRPEGAAAHADIPNLAAVKFRPDRPGRGVDNSEPIVFWIGGQMTEKGLEWLMMKGFKLLVDLRVEGEKSGPRLEAALYRANTSGRMRLVNMPVPIGTAPSMGQVKKFARLVADSDNTPLFLFSRAGFGRTCSMVTRWRESVLRGGVELGGEGDVRRDSPQPNTVDKGIVLLNGVFLEARSEGGDTIDSPRSENTITPIECSVATSVSQGQLGSTAERGLLPSVALNDISGVPVVTLPGNGNPAKDVIEQYEGVEVLFRMKNAFEAQRPGPDVFSRQGMTLYKKRAKVRPLGTSTPLLKDPASSAKSHHVPSKADDIAGPAGTWGLSTRGIPRAPPASDRTSSSFELEACTSEGIHGESSISATTVMNSKEQGYPNQAASNGALVKIAGNDKVPDESSDDASPVQGDMCASTTGVVRLQSRKKAEMYLVRTDGFSCTREKVKESTLAFTHPSTQQQMLMWKTSPKTVLLLKKLGNELMEEAQQVAAFLYHQERMNVMVEPEVHDRFARFPGFGFVQTFYNQDSGELHEMVDFVVCLGGDGVILHASNLFRSAVPPVVSFNLGSLGFLTTHPFQNFKQDLRAIIHGNTGMEGVYITLRMRLRCELFRNGKLVPGKVFDVLNEVVVDRGSNPYLCKIECFERNRLITKVQADGVLVATPTGSTAYSTAAGGSMVHPNVPCMLFTPICPHSLSFRPVILPDSALLELKVPLDARNNAWVSFDGKRRQQLCKGDSVRIAMSEHPLPTVNKSDQTDDWFSSLVRCLNWNERLEQKAFVS